MTFSPYASSEAGAVLASQSGKTSSDPFLRALQSYAANNPTGSTSSHSSGGGHKTSGGNSPVPTASNPQGSPGGMGSRAQEFYSWDQQKLSQFRNQLQLAGYSSGTMNRLQLASAWNDLSKESDAYAAAGKKISPYDILNTDAASGNVGPKTKTTTSSIVNYTDPNTARSIVNQSMAALMGRNPTNQEIKQFTDALHSYEAKNPQVSQQTVDTNTGQITDSKTVDKRINQPGMQQMAEDQIKSTKEYGSVQAATTYMDALRKMVG